MVIMAEPFLHQVLAKKKNLERVNLECKSRSVAKSASRSQLDAVLVLFKVASSYVSGQEQF